MHSMLPSLRAEAGSDEFAGRPEFDQAYSALRDAWELRDPHLIAVSRDLAGGRVEEAVRGDADEVRQGRLGVAQLLREH